LATSLMLNNQETKIESLPGLDAQDNFEQ